MSATLRQARQLRQGDYLPEYVDTVDEVLRLEDFVAVTLTDCGTVKVLHELDEVEVWE
ncbi:Uncharacterised protein [Mycobacteroides abscessus subsp. abscessus]|uniref:Uncharacterized protein n=1 Tax=Mycobacteroides abscessus subsp. abscessus TaxID=1185650 RepID=A0AB38D103_9MYCO|nr:hypothetical protein [Mycobacteroides abscessus]SHX05227.1 Uncharacterised protein [Mycobacteroides abscessus subsp. abscessus]SIA13612.1 Uncharacterised protein [Mycobacteroides abscessus subsp. abscessus]SIB13176.1 Uncharacterised protein [Mycobacteroides abscessus subsp. abscessus]SIB15734.1 Uncharacterised protein [Mycobacteroides abscessus subsp. abscessus]SIB19709.1 Uncharacterised protein [Mycobacteroides abscessus subsp. abscessus]